MEKNEICTYRKFDGTQPIDALRVPSVFGRRRRRTVLRPLRSTRIVTRGLCFGRTSFRGVAIFRQQRRDAVVGVARGARLLHHRRRRRRRSVHGTLYFHGGDDGAAAAAAATAAALRRGRCCARSTDDGLRLVSAALLTRVFWLHFVFFHLT